MKNKYCICIFIYKETLDNYEKLSLLRLIDYCYTNNDIDKLIWVISKSFLNKLDDFYKKYIDKFIQDKYHIKEININYLVYDDIAFESLNAYNNRLMLNANFYGDFVNKYEYMLIYHLNSYIFNNNLNYFLDKNYEYIGGYFAPDYESYSIVNSKICSNIKDINNEHHLIMNGGASLRNIQYCINTLIDNYDLIEGCDYNSIFKYFNEDEFFSLYYKTNIKAIDSIRFSLNWLGAENYWAIIDFQYPFMCHGINKNKFLMKLIEKYNKENNLDYSSYI